MKFNKLKFVSLFTLNQNVSQYLYNCILSLEPNYTYIYNYVHLPKPSSLEESHHYRSKVIQQKKDG